MWVMKNNSSIIADKNTLLATSFQPTPLKRVLPISQFFCLRRICHSTEDFKGKAVDMKNRFAQRGYPSQWVMHMNWFSKRRALADLKRVRKKFFVTCITQHSTHSNAIKSVFKKQWHVLKSNSKLSSIFEDPSLFVNNKWEKNIRDHLVCASFYQEEKSNVHGTSSEGQLPLWQLC